MKRRDARRWKTSTTTTTLWCIRFIRSLFSVAFIWYVQKQHKKRLRGNNKKKEKKRREKKKKTNEEQKQSAKEHAQNEMRNLATSQKSAFSSFYSFSVPSFDSYISRSENDETLYAFAKSITKSSHLCVAFVKTIRERQRRNCRHCYCYYFFAVLVCRCHRRRFHITKRTERKILALYVCNCVCVLLYFFFCFYFCHRLCI